MEEEQEVEDRVQEAIRVAERMETANKHAEKILEEQQRLEARRVISGRTEAGKTKVEPSAEERRIASARSMLKGTGYDKMLFPEGE